MAIKLIRPGVVRQELVQRFETERQILASLQQTGIARLLDGGTTEQGLPYLVMEYVDGQPIDRYCDQHRLNIDQRLRMFCKACEAIQFAHQNLIMHRDLKAANILVTAAGEVKLLDFGIAKLLEPLAGVANPALTRTGVQPMTPENASPEQIEGRPITTASDVYALGVMLYQLLTGRPPYRLENYSASELQRVILETAPSRPSTAVGQATSDDKDEQETSTISRKRGMDPVRLHRRLHGDLDNIVLKALQKQAERRYASVEQFSADIHNHLNGLPVTARPDTWAYRSGRFVQRHKVGTILSVAMALVLLGVTAREISLRKETEQAHAATRQEAAKTEAVSDFLEELLASVDPVSGQGKDVTVKEILDQASATLKGKENPFLDQPLIEAKLRTTLSESYRSLGRYQEASAEIDKALVLQRQFQTQPDLQTAEILRQRAITNLYQGRYEQAAPLFEQALSLFNNLLGNEHAEVAKTNYQLGVNYTFGHQELGDFRATKKAV